MANKRILIVEDQPLLAMLLQQILTDAGMKVVGIVADGVEEIELALREQPDIILSNIHMPRMDGLTAARCILDQYPACIIFITSESENDYRRQAVEMGAAGYILKPFTMRNLVPRLQEMVAGWQLRHGLWEGIVA